MKKKRLGVVLGVAMLAAMNVIPAFASDDNHGYSYVIKAGYANTYSDSRYRQTTNTSNPWKVNMTYSGEGAGTVTTYWLALYNSAHTLVSGTHDVKQGSGAHYYTATSQANQKDACLIYGE